MTSSFEVIALRKVMIWSIIAILFFSSLSFLFNTQFLSKEQIENGTEPAVIDADLGLTETEPQDSTASTEDQEPSLPSESRKPNIPPSNMDEMTSQDSEDVAQNDGSQMLAGSEVPDDYGGTVRAVGVAIYSDISISDPLVSIDWGELRPGGSKTVQCYIQNTGEAAEVLTLHTDNWTPSSAKSYMVLTWDYDGEPLNINEVIPVNLTLFVSVNIDGITTFFFDITIIGNSCE